MGKEQNLGRVQVKQLYSLHTTWISLIQLLVVELYTCFTLGYVQAESGVSSLQYPYPGRNLYVTSHLYGYFLHHRRELQKTIKTTQVLLTELRNCYVRQSSFEVNHLSQMHKRCKTGTPGFLQCHGRKFSSKTLICLLFIYFSFSACCHQLNYFLTYYTVG